MSEGVIGRLLAALDQSRSAALQGDHDAPTQRRRAGPHRHDRPPAAPQRRRLRHCCRAARGVHGLRRGRGGLGRRPDRGRRRVLRRRRSQGAGRRGPPSGVRRRAGTDGADPAPPHEARHRRDRGSRGCRRARARPVVRPAGRRFGCRARRVLPAVRRAARRPGNDPPAAADRAQPGHRSDPDGARRRRRRGGADGPGQPRRPAGSGADGGRRPGPRAGRAAADLHAQRPSLGASSNGTSPRTTRCATRWSSGGRRSRAARRRPERRGSRPGPAATAPRFRRPPDRGALQACPVLFGGSPVDTS